MSKRLSNIDLLRCLSMMLIVAGHYFGNVEGNANFSMNSTSYFLRYLIAAIEGVGVNIFVLISGYFLINSKFRIKRLIGIWIQVIIYSVVMYLLAVLFNLQVFSVFKLLYSFTPIFNRTYWFATEYIRLYLIFPFLNILVKNLTQKQHKYLVGLLVFMNALYPTFMNMDNRLKFLGNWSLWFITLYIIAAYIRLYDIRIKASYLVGIWGICTFAMFASKILINNVTFKFIGKVVGTDLLSHNNSIFMLGAALSLFLLFAKISITNSKIEKLICVISPLTFGIYLFHENPFWKQAIYNFIHECWSSIGINSWGMYWIQIGLVSIIIIYFTGCLIDCIRTLFYMKVVENSKFFDKLFGLIQKKIDKVIEL